MANLRFSMQPLTFLLIAGASLSIQACQNPNLRLGFPGMDSRDDGAAPVASNAAGTAQKPAAAASPNPTSTGVACVVRAKVEATVAETRNTDGSLKEEGRSSLPELAELEALALTEPTPNKDELKQMYASAKGLGLDAAAAKALVLSYAENGADKAPIKLASGKSISRRSANYWAFKTAFDASEGQYAEGASKRRADIISKIVLSENPLAAAAAYKGALKVNEPPVAHSADEKSGKPAVATLSESEIAIAERVAVGPHPDQLLLVYRRALEDSGATESDAIKAQEFASGEACLQKDQIPSWPDDGKSKQPAAARIKLNQRVPGDRMSAADPDLLD